MAGAGAETRVEPEINNFGSAALRYPNLPTSLKTSLKMGSNLRMEMRHWTASTQHSRLRLLFRIRLTAEQATCCSWDVQQLFFEGGGGSTRSRREKAKEKKLKNAWTLLIIVISNKKIKNKVN